MNLKHKIITGGILAFLTLAAGNLQAELQPELFTNLVTVNLTGEFQAGTNIIGGIITVSPPIKESATTKQILGWLAKDETAEGNYNSNSFPAGSQLVLLVDETAGTNDFRVLTKTGQFLVDVSDILGADHDGTTNFVVAGKKSEATGLYDPSGTETRLSRFFFDDTAIAGGLNLKFFAVGLEVKTVTDSTPKSGLYTESVSTTVSASSGDGNDAGTPFVVTGNFGYSGKVIRDE